MKPYRLTANIEWTSKCNAKCAMCPRHVIDQPKLMDSTTFNQMMARLDSRDLVRAIIAGYGEPTTHPKFFEFIDAVRQHPLQFDMVSNGALLDESKLDQLDGALGMLMVSFSSVDPQVYQQVHTNLDQQQVMNNLKLAKQRLRHTRLSVSLTPMPECLDTLPDTIEWFHSIGINDLRMSPNFYNRAGSLEQQQDQTRQLRAIIDRYQLRALDLDFVPGAMDVVRQLGANRFKCIPRNSSLFITSNGEYLYCYNDMAHSRPLGNIEQLSVRQAIQKREQMQADEQLCQDCNMRGRYQGWELAQMAVKHLGNQLIARTG